MDFPESILGAFYRGFPVSVTPFAVKRDGKQTTKLVIGAYISRAAILRNCVRDST